MIASRTLLLVTALVSATAACATVPAHQRERLAHPTLQDDFERSAARDHVHAIHEGSSGGDLGASSGCGCN